MAKELKADPISSVSSETMIPNSYLCTTNKKVSVTLEQVGETTGMTGESGEV